MLVQGVLNDEAPVRQHLPMKLLLLLLQAVLLRQTTVDRSRNLAHSKSRRRPEPLARLDRRRRLEDRLEEDLQEEQLCVALLEKCPYVQLKKRLQMISYGNRMQRRPEQAK